MHSDDSNSCYFISWVWMLTVFKCGKKLEQLIKIMSVSSDSLSLSLFSILRPHPTP